MRPERILAVLLPFLLGSYLAMAMENCPMPAIRSVVEKAAKSGGRDAALQMQVIRRITEDIYGGSWGVLILKNPDLISSLVHWTIPDHTHEGAPAFCLYSFDGWHYNVFKTGNQDGEQRLSVEEAIRRATDKGAVLNTEFDQMLNKDLKRHSRQSVFASVTNAE